MAAHICGPLNWTRLGREGRPMIFLHPNPMDHSAWLYQMAHFSTWFQTVGIDLPGYGRSPGVEPGVTMSDIGQACWEAADAATTSEPAILVGLSVGGHLVRQMCHLRPDQTAALIIAGHGYRPEKPNMLRRAEQYETRGVEFRREHALEDFSRNFRNSALAQYFADMFQERNAWADAKAIATVFRAYAAPDPDWLTAGIDVPALIVTGSEDNAHQAAFELQKRIRGCELVTIEGAGHACNIEQPWAFDAALLGFLDKHGFARRSDTIASARSGTD